MKVSCVRKSRTRSPWRVPRATCPRTAATVKLRDSKIIENAPEGTVGEGSVVTIELNGNEMTYVLGSRDIVAGTDYDIMTPDSPIGKAIEGAKVGDVVSYTAPNGRELSVTVKAAKPLA